MPSREILVKNDPLKPRVFTSADSQNPIKMTGKTKGESTRAKKE